MSYSRKLLKTIKNKIVRKKELVEREHISLALRADRVTVSSYKYLHVCFCNTHWICRILFKRGLKIGEKEIRFSKLIVTDIIG